jgi:hypothetical protein
LEGPPFPDALSYLWEVFERLDMMRSSGMNGWERFTPTHIINGMRLFDWELHPHEIEAIVALDMATMYPDETAEQTVAAPRPDAPWPGKE